MSKVGKLKINPVGVSRSTRLWQILPFSLPLGLCRFGRLLLTSLLGSKETVGGGGRGSSGRGRGGWSGRGRGGRARGGWLVQCLPPSAAVCVFFLSFSQFWTFYKTRGSRQVRASCTSWRSPRALGALPGDCTGNLKVFCFYADIFIFLCRCIYKDIGNFFFLPCLHRLESENFWQRTEEEAQQHSGGRLGWGFF